MKGWFAVETTENCDAVIDHKSVHGVIELSDNTRSIIFGSAYVQTRYSMQECLALIASAKAVFEDPDASPQILINLRLIKDLAARTAPAKVVTIKKEKE